MPAPVWWGGGHGTELWVLVWDRYLRIRSRDGDHYGYDLVEGQIYQGAIVTGRISQSPETKIRLDTKGVGSCD